MCVNVAFADFISTALPLAATTVKPPITSVVSNVLISSSSKSYTVADVGFGLAASSCSFTSFSYRSKVDKLVTSLLSSTFNR